MIIYRLTYADDYEDHSEYHFLHKAKAIFKANQDAGGITSGWKEVGAGRLVRELKTSIHYWNRQILEEINVIE